MKDVIMPNTLTCGPKKECNVGSVADCCPGTRSSITDFDQGC